MAGGLTHRCRTSLIAVAVLGAATVAVVAAAAGSGDAAWIAKADAVCAVWNQREARVFGPAPSLPQMPSERFKFLVKARRIEAGKLAALRAIPSRPREATAALLFAQADVAELDKAIAAYHSGSSAEFLRDVGVWWHDDRTSGVFLLLGATECAG
jgi:hypothetical protein